MVWRGKDSVTWARPLSCPVGGGEGPGTGISRVRKGSRVCKMAKFRYWYLNSWVNVLA
jgi:hypothetical protein